MSSPDSNLDQEIKTLEQNIASLIEELRRSSEIPCASLRHLTSNFLRVVITRVVEKLRDLRLQRDQENN